MTRLFENNAGLVQNKFVQVVLLSVLRTVLIRYAKDVKRNALKNMHLVIHSAKCIVNKKIYIMTSIIIVMRDFKKLLRKIPLYNEYYYPNSGCSLFLMPDGRLYGKPGIMQHESMFEEMLGRKVDDRKFMKLMAESNISRIIVNNKPMLHLDCMADPTSMQIATLRDLVNYGNYWKVVIGTYPEVVPDSPSENQIRKLLGIKPLLFEQTMHSKTTVPQHRRV